MQIPSLPTDNLYKFISLSGLALILLTGYKFLNFIDEYTKEKQIVKLKIYELKSKEEKLQKDLLNLEKLITSKGNNFYKIKIDQRAKTKTHEKGIRLYKKILENMLKYKPSQYDRIMSISSTLDHIIELKSKHDELENFRTEINIGLEKLLIIREAFLETSIIYTLFIISGLSFFIVGLKLWYNRHQIFEDIIIKKQSEK